MIETKQLQCSALKRKVTSHYPEKGYRKQGQKSKETDTRASDQRDTGNRLPVSAMDSEICIRIIHNRQLIILAALGLASHLLAHFFPSRLASVSTGQIPVSSLPTLSPKRLTKAWMYSHQSLLRV
jgi:hypothetical protein